MAVPAFRSLSLGVLRIPDALRDIDNPRQPSSSVVVVSRLVQLAVQDDYADSYGQLRLANPDAFAALVAYGEGLPAQFGVDDTEDLDLTHSQRRRRDTAELVLSLVLRTASMHITSFFTVCLSALALRSGVAVEFWGILRHLGLVRGKKWIKGFCVQVAEALRLKATEGSSNRVAFTVADNCSYPIKTTHQHANRNGFRKDTVNWLTVPIDPARFPMTTISRGQWHNATSRFVTLPLFDPRRDAFRNLRHFAWLGFVGQSLGGLDILAHPSVAAPPQRVRTVYQQPVLNVDTASYADIDTSATHISNQMLAGKEMIMVVGDQQLFIRLLWCKIYDALKWQWMLPLPGEWHFLVHVLMAIHKLWYAPVVAKLVADHPWGLEFQKTIKAKWTSVELYVYYDRFYQLLTWGLTDYVTDPLVGIPAAYQLDPRMLLEAVAANQTAVYAFTMLHDFLFPCAIATRSPAARAVVQPRRRGTHGCALPLQVVPPAPSHPGRRARDH